VLLDPPHPGERLSQLAVHARGDVQEPELLALDSVHQDDANAGEGVDVELAVGTADHFLPAQGLVVERNATFLDEVETHGWAPLRMQRAVPCGRRSERATRRPALHPAGREAAGLLRVILVAVRAGDGATDAFIESLRVDDHLAL